MENKNEIAEDWLDITSRISFKPNSKNAEFYDTPDILRALGDVCSKKISGADFQKWMEANNPEFSPYRKLNIPAVLRKSNVAFLNDGQKCAFVSVGKCAKPDYRIMISFSNPERTFHKKLIVSPEKLIFETFDNPVFNYFKLKYFDDTQAGAQYIRIFCKVNPYCDLKYAGQKEHKEMNKLNFRRFIEKFEAGKV